MSKKKKKHKCSGKCCGNCYGVLWIAGSNVSKASRKQANAFLEEGGTVYIIEGKPPGGGCLPGQPGCQ